MHSWYFWILAYCHVRIAQRIDEELAFTIHLIVPILGPTEGINFLRVSALPLLQGRLVLSITFGSLLTLMTNTSVLFLAWRKFTEIHFLVNEDWRKVMALFFFFQSICILSPTNGFQNAKWCLYDFLFSSGPCPLSLVWIHCFPLWVSDTLFVSQRKSHFPSIFIAM